MQHFQAKDDIYDVVDGDVVRALAEVGFRVLREVDVDRVLTHGDLWSGNTLWEGDRLTGIVDWSGAMSAPRGVDIAWCRQDLVLLGSTVAADEDTEGTTNLLTLARRLHEEHVREGVEKRDALIAEGTSDHLKAQVGGHRVVVTLVDQTDGDAATTVLRRYGTGDVEVSGDGRPRAVAV
ncbi:phosphotransferase, partial [Bacillus sp. S34]|nr:phosphotransferase [Bacillus sp. S34]